MWGGAQQLQCKSESVQCSEKQQSPCEGGGGLKLEKINLLSYVLKGSNYALLM